MMPDSNIISVLQVSRDTPAFEESFKGLKLAGFRVKKVHSFSEVLQTITEFNAEVILLDAQLGTISCFELCHTIRAITAFKQIRVFIISETRDSTLEIMAFDSGADDFICSPLNLNVLIRRIRLRAGKNPGVISVQSRFNRSSKLRIDRESYTVFLNQDIIPLSRLEFELLHLLASQPGKVFTREEIFNHVWKKKSIEKDRTIDVHILRLRKKIGITFITTQKGIGYRFVM